MDVVVVIRFVAVEIIPRKRLAQEKACAKRTMRKRVREAFGSILGAQVVSVSKLHGTGRAFSNGLLSYVQSITYS